jgi:hypothetical protein
MPLPFYLKVSNQTGLARLRDVRGYLREIDYLAGMLIFFGALFLAFNKQRGAIPVILAGIAFLWFFLKPAHIHGGTLFESRCARFFGFQNCFSSTELLTLFLRFLRAGLRSENSQRIAAILYCADVSSASRECEKTPPVLLQLLHSTFVQETIGLLSGISEVNRR